jgi:hypothetical protein
MEHAPRDGFAIVRLLIPVQHKVDIPGSAWRCFFSENRMPSFAYIDGPASDIEDAKEFLPKDWENGEFLVRLHAGTWDSGFFNDLQKQVDRAGALWGSELDEQAASMIKRGLDHETSWLEVAAIRGVTLDCQDCSAQAVNDTTRGALSVIYAMQLAQIYSADQPVWLTTAETVQAFVPIQLTHCRLSGEVVARTGTYLVMPYAMVSRTHLKFEEPPAESDAKWVLRSISRGRIFARHFELVAEAAEAVYLRGQPSQALMVSAQACEYLLDTFLLFMMWWDGMKPKDGASEFEASSNLIFARIKASYESRLGASWIPDSGLLARWRDAVVRPRNRVIHGGSRVGMAEAEEALVVARDLRGFLAEICKEPPNAAKYPPLLSLLVGDERLPDRWSGMTERDFYRHPDFPADRFQAWIALFQGELALSTKPKEESAQVLAVANNNGGFEWWLYDPDSHKVAEVDVKSVDRAFKRRIESDMGTLRQGTRRKYARIGVHPVPRIKPGATWRSAVAHGPGLPWECPWKEH